MSEAIFPVVATLNWNRVAHEPASKALFAASKELPMGSERL